MRARCGHEGKGDLHPGGQLHVPGDRGEQQTGAGRGPGGSPPGERPCLLALLTAANASVDCRVCPSMKSVVV